MGSVSLIRGFIRYWLNAVNQHSLHAPFVYDFYNRIIKNDQQEDIFHQIEHFRRQLFLSEEIINTNSPGAPSRISTQSQRKVADIARNGITNPKHSRLLYRIGREIQPEVIIELGTSLGINTLYLSAAWPEATVYTFEGCPKTASLARDLFDQWPYRNIHLIEGNIDQTLEETLKEVVEVSLAYMDANHRYAPTLNYYQQLHKKASLDSIFVLDDIHWSSEMEKAWKVIRLSHEVSLSLDLFELGILFFKDLKVKQHHYLMY